MPNPLPTWLALLASLAALAAAPAAATAEKKVKRAVNADKVGGLRASKTPKPGRLLALDKAGKLPLSVFPDDIVSRLSAVPGAPGAQGPAGPQGPKGDTGTVDTSRFYDKEESDARFLGKDATAVNAGKLDGRGAGGYLQVNPAARQDPPAAPEGTPALWLRPSTTAGGGPYSSDFRLNNDGGFLLGGTLGIGHIPATGCGLRTMWHPFKGAFRSGNPGECPTTNWDEANVGFYTWAGGSGTVASAFTALAFGDQAKATGVSSVALGSATTAGGAGATAAGASTRAEGFANTALGYATRAAGQGSTAIGYRSAALGDHSVALGFRAVAAAGCPVNDTCDINSLNPATAGYDGAFVWGDASSNASVSASANNQWTTRAAGGYRFFTNPTLTTGCNLPAGSGVFSCTSDRNEKTAFAPVAGEEVLERLSDVPVTTWRYKSEKGGVRHMGPMAQDFRKAFGLGTDDRHIGGIDADGVNMAAIKALYALSKRQQRRLEDQEARIERLERAVEALTAGR